MRDRSGHHRALPRTAKREQQHHSTSSRPPARRSPEAPKPRSPEAPKPRSPQATPGADARSEYIIGTRGCPGGNRYVPSSRRCSDSNRPNASKSCSCRNSIRSPAWTSEVTIYGRSVDAPDGIVIQGNPTPRRPGDEEQMAANAQAQIGVTGLGVMGRNLARNFARHGYAVALHNRTASRVTDTVDQFGHEGTFVATPDRPGLRTRPAKAKAPAHHGQRGRGHRRGDRRVRPAARAGGHAHRRRQRPLPRHPPPRGRPHANKASTSSAWASPAARKARCTARPSCPADQMSPTRPSAPCSRRSAPTSTEPRAAPTSARTAPATSSRWCTTASSTPTCSSSPKPTTCSGTPSASRPPRPPRRSSRGTPVGWTPT